MELLIALGTDDGTNLNDDHVGMAKYFHVYKFSQKEEEFVEKRENVKLKGDESMKHGDPQKAKATSSVLQGIDVLVGRRFGPNLPRLVKKFVCVIVRTDTLENAISIIRQNMEKIIVEKNKGEDRQHLILK
jgi:predicted Fe-Mo cluster-binding NifX family protein